MLIRTALLAIVFEPLQRSVVQQFEDSQELTHQTLPATQLSVHPFVT